MQAEDSACQNKSTSSPKKMTSMKWGHNSIMAPLKASKMLVQGPFGAEFITQDLPCIFWEARILMVLDPLNGSRPCSPHGPQTAAHGPQTANHTLRTIGPQEPQMGKNGHKFIKSKKCTQDPEKAKMAINSISIKNHHRKGQGPIYYGKAKEDSRPDIEEFPRLLGRRPS
ncbi:hypothetical protein O181_054167 [Austropuccinia psidii MF-1]|uniref:Uncharacterized protein n=1 Tax=Austropuccinia psidii MF-1 TaxID=1389203 RepID=A0A9Q3HS92_9BASI|nr:hypothetical protein [Austropuccinia psidii MF-1]